MKKVTEITIVEKLEKYYPEHKVFALDSINSTLRENVSIFAKKEGVTVEVWLKKHGFDMISGEEVRKLRDKVIYKPGNEPKIINDKIDSILKRLQENYPDHVVKRGIQNDHKKLASDISGVYQWLGYKDISAFLTAYGYKYEIESKGGRPTEDKSYVIEELKKRYEGKEHPHTVLEIIQQNPDLRGKLKTMQNDAYNLFGKSLKNHFIDLGIIGPSEKTLKEAIEKKEWYYSFDAVDIAENKPLFCISKSSIISVGDPVWVKGQDGTLKICVITEVYEKKCEDELKKPVSEALRYYKKCNKGEVLKEIADKKIDTSKLNVDLDFRKKITADLIYCGVRIRGNDTTLYYISPFDDIVIGDIVNVDYWDRGIVEGVVTMIKPCNKGDKLPFPAMKTKKIQSIAIKRSEFVRKSGDYKICRIKSEYGYEKNESYLCDSNDVEVGDFVLIDDRYQNELYEVIEVKDADFAKSPTQYFTLPLIEAIAKKRFDEKKARVEAYNALKEKYSTVPFKPTAVSKSVSDKMKKVIYMSGAVFRGLETDIEAVLRLIYNEEFDPTDRMTRLGDGIAQFECPNKFVSRIISEFPSLKGVFFAEYWAEDEVYLAYSESGYGEVTILRKIGKCAFYASDRWTIKHDPTEKSFDFKQKGISGTYTFDELSAWESLDYVISGNTEKLCGKKAIATAPYVKDMYQRYAVNVRINYPSEEEEKATNKKVEQQKREAAEKAKQKEEQLKAGFEKIETAGLKGTTFVVTGDLKNFESRDDLKKLLEMNGGRLVGSVSSLTTAVITNEPNSGTRKLWDAERFGKEVISEDEFIKRYFPNGVK